ncbi:hypothetical protein OFL75_19325 [Pseudomonas aeruginosa]|jgi:hypothetical protein|uniref:DUF7740 domain-containing protein n=5 Tax=Pseudomonas TaxID=286 RepID=A0A1V0M6K6_PSEAI|nr:MULTISPECIES: hypothetical protein [Pseudomonas]AVX92819.1 hypothetical protein PkP19E3_32265 [Pseudomonas koreensis]MCP8472968.1 hypothetical protein [Pseudomonas triclosanedens]MCP8479538.1 hypothetical protein [Pseudomonas triclosanedens]WQN30346.1 hypothetical protein ULE26_22510 [Stutzerimonas stutzeri]AGL46409.1 hypothetical protein pOZ176_451 [Pseudomonas aeruginosa PA96]
MRPLDVILCLALAATYHRTDAAVVATAKRLLKRVERRDRQSLFDVINHKTPCRYIIHHLVNLPDEVICMDLPAERVAPHIKLSMAKAQAASAIQKPSPAA